MTELLLDTNVVVWLLLGDRRSVSDAAQHALADERNRIRLSAVSVWEIAIKRSIGKLDIEERWADTLLRLDVDPLPVVVEHARHVERLPWHHRNPFDRLLVAQAAVERAALVTADAQLGRYGVDTVW